MKYAIAALIALVFCLFIRQCFLVTRITNVERQMLHIEQENKRIIEQNIQLKRINDQNLKLLSQGGW
jgi:hypothetical protein